MTISSTTNRKSFTGAGTTGPFAFPYSLLAKSDLVVLSVLNSTGVPTTLVLDTDYTLAGTADSVGRYAAGVDITTMAAVAVGRTLVAYRDPAQTQTLDLVENDPLPAEQVEKAFDNAALVSQRNRDLIGRSLQLPDSDTSGTTATLPSAVSRASRVLGFDASGLLTTYSAASAVTDAENVTFLQAGTGAVSRTVRSKERDIVSLKDFGAAIDGATDDTAAWALAQVAAETAGAALFVPAGTTIVDTESTHGSIYSTGNTLRIYGDGMENTTIKNTASGGGCIRVQTSSFEMHDITIDNNGSTGIAVWLESQLPILRNVVIKNQAGALVPALLVDGATQAVLDNVQLRTCATGLEIGRSFDTLYPYITRLVVGECTSGPALKMRRTSNATLFGCYLEASVVATFDMSGCYNCHFYGFDGEFTADSGALTAASYFLIDASENISFNGGWLSHTGTVSKILFKTTGVCSNIRFDRMYMLTTKTGMTFYSFDGGSSRNFSILRQRAYGVSAFTGVNCVANINKLTVDQWDTGGSGPCTHVFAGYRFFLKDIDDDFSLDDSGSRGVIVNCSGTITGTHSSDRVGSGSATAYSPSVFLGGSNTGVTYSTQEGSYTISGGRCHFDSTQVLTSKGAQTGALTIGLAKTAATRTGASTLVNVTLHNAAAGVTTNVVGTIASAGTVIAISKYTAGSLTALADTDIANNTTIRCSGSYEI